MVDPSLYGFSKLDQQFKIKDFKSGIHSLDHFLKTWGIFNQEKNLTQTFILHKINEFEVIGYYSISTSSCIKKSLPNEMTEDLPSYPIPCIILGRLAVDRNYKGKGFGKFILYDALKRAKAISNLIGCFAVIVDTIDLDAANFYKKYGFIEFIDRKLSLFIPISTIP